MWRTSSPISYGRSCASSVPTPTPAARRSPGQRPRHEPGDRDVERLDQRLRHRARALPRRRRREHRSAHRALSHGSAVSSDQVRGVRLGDGGEHPLEQLVGGDPLAERVVGQHDPVAEHVGGEVADVVGRRRDRGRAAARARARPGPARSARAGSSRTRSSAATSCEPVARRVPGRVGERDRVADHLAVDEHRLRPRPRSGAGRRATGTRCTSAGAREAASDDGRLLARRSGSRRGSSSGSGRPAPRAAG